MNLKAVSKNEQVYRQLRAMILEAELDPGERIVIDRVAAQLGVSAIPIREALSQLEAEGFVTQEPNVGARVSALDAHEIEEVFELLGVLELRCAKRACLMMTDTELALFESLVREMEELSHDPGLWAKRNRDLHLFLAERAGKKLMTRLLMTVLDHWDRLRNHYLRDVFVKRIPAAQQDHYEMLAALKARDARALEATIDRHNQTAFRAYQKHLIEKARQDLGLT